MKTFLNAFGWILTAAAITISALAIIAALDYATNY